MIGFDFGGRYLLKSQTVSWLIKEIKVGFMNALLLRDVFR